MSYSDEQVVALVRRYINASNHPDLVIYRRDFDEKFDHEAWARVLRKRCELGGFFGKELLEVGCGFGWDAVGLALIGNNRVTATDVLPSMIEGVNECLQVMATEGIELSVEPQVGDICSLNLPEDSFDGIFTSEAVEHVHDLALMFSNCFRMLRTGGRLLIVNDSNCFNSAFRESTFEMWKERDESWDHAHWLEAEVRPIEHKGAKPYAAMRELIIKEAAPTLSGLDIDRLIAATAGMIRPEICNAVAHYQENASLPERPRFSWCRNPETGEYAERLLDPFEMREMLRSAGFHNVKLRHGFNRFPHRLLNNVEFRPLNEFLFDRRGLFILTADKPN
ncbi:MAG: class I SAM-dependent methyltransferase [Sphingomonadales bacterium]